MAETKKSIEFKMSLLPIFALAMIGLKVFGFIDWSWPVVLAPTFLMLVPLAVFVIILLAGMAFVAVVAVLAIVAAILDL